jgi:hypothetical protein
MEDDHKLLVGKDLEGGDSSQFQADISGIYGTYRGKP